MLSQKNLSQLNVDDDKLNRIQTNVATVLDPVLATPIIDGVLVQNLTIPASGVLVVPHNLGRKALGIMVVMASAAVSMPYALPANQGTPTGGIVLTFSSGAGALVNIWVF